MWFSGLEASDCIIIKQSAAQPHVEKQPKVQSDRLERRLVESRNTAGLTSHHTDDKSDSQFIPKWFFIL